jgi:predicted AlkP superfamily phosphohydrolase/phosphomutase
LAADTLTIDKLWQNGAFSFHARTDERTVSGPCWSSMLTGVWSAKHGILDNQFPGAPRYPHFFERITAAQGLAMAG